MRLWRDFTRVRAGRAGGGLLGGVTGVPGASQQGDQAAWAGGAWCLVSEREELGWSQEEIAGELGVRVRDVERCRRRMEGGLDLEAWVPRYSLGRAPLDRELVLKGQDGGRGS